MRNLVTTLVETAPLIHRSATPGGVLKRTKYFLRGLAYARDTAEWFDILQAPEMAFIIKNNPCLFHKLQRPYLNCVLKTTDRLHALKQHYTFVLTHFSKAMIGEVFTGSGKLLVELLVEKVGPMELRLNCSGMQKEGDLSIGLWIKAGKRPMATLSFSVWKFEANEKEIFIGGLQGSKIFSEEDVVAVTRGLHGLRPKALLFYALQQLAVHWKVNHVRAVSNATHIYRHFQARRNVAASYDTFWIECGGVAEPDGSFALPAAFIPREISTIRVNKRQMYRRRYAMLERIAAEISTRLSSGQEEKAGDISTTNLTA